jgi:hypothetical protein
MGTVMMRGRRHLVALGAGLLVLSSVSVRVSAEPLEELLDERPSPESLDFRSKMERSVNEAREAAGRLSPQYPTTIRHLRFEGGVPFADAQVSNEMMEKMKKAAIEQGKGTYKELIKTAEKRVKEWESPPDYEECASSNEEKIDFALEDLPGEEQVVGDILFLADNPPLNFEEKFGENVQLQVLNQKSSPVARGFAESLQLSCLPSRIRLTNRALYRYQGDAALGRFEVKGASRSTRAPTPSKR